MSETMQRFDEPRRWAELVAAQDKAEALFAAVLDAGLLRAGVSETALSQEIHALAAERFGVRTHWHRKVVRAGPNTVATFYDDPPEHVIAEGDLVFLDFGPVFDDWEADYGRCYLLGDDPEKARLVADLDAVFAELTAVFGAQPDITGAELYAEAHRAAERRGWRFGGTIAGHLVGEFPHTDFPGGREASLIAPVNVWPMRDKDADGRVRYWILEVHLVEPGGRWGGFCEALLRG